MNQFFSIFFTTKVVKHLNSIKHFLNPFSSRPKALTEMVFESETNILLGKRVFKFTYYTAII
jgi:hypothetical protein